jgi:hypothetical protein
MATPSTVITRHDLSVPFFEFNQSMQNQGFIGGRVLGMLPVGIQSANMTKVTIETMLKIQADDRAPGSGYNRGDFKFEKFSYATDEHGWEEPLDDRTIAIYQELIDAETIHSQRAVGFIQRNYERAVAAAVMNATTWSSNTTAITHEWDDATNGVPITNVEAAKRAIRLASGLEANAWIGTRNMAFNAMQTAQVVDRLKYNGPLDPQNFANYTEQDLARTLGVDHAIIAGGLYDSANEAKSFSGASIWSEEYSMVCRVAETDDPQESCIGRTFMWTGDGTYGAAGADNEIAVHVEEYRDESVRGGVIRARNDRDIKILYVEAGHLLSNMVT